MNILHLLAPARTGGLERVVQGLAIGHRDRGHNVLVAVIVQEPTADHPFRIPLDRAGIEVRDIVVPLRGYGAERRAVVDLCRTFRPDVVHSHGYRPDVVDAGAIRRLGIASVATYHGETAGPWRNRVYEFLHQRVLRLFDAVIAVSEPIANRLRSAGVPDARLHIVPNAWSPISQLAERDEARRLLALPPAEPVAGWIGRMSREKGIDVFIDALAVMGTSAPRAVAIGDGPERIAEQARAAALLGERMAWPGLIPEAGRLCRAFDVFVLSSRTEGIPIALLEAIAAGTPVVATRVGGVPEVVSDAEALLVPSESPRQLADAISSVLADPTLARERAERAKARVTEFFGPERWLAKHEQIYERAQTIRQSTSRVQQAI